MSSFSAYVFIAIGVLCSSAAIANDNSSARQEPKDMIQEQFGAGIYAHDPIYVIGGGSPETDIRLQLSFKVRVFSRLYLGYTQNSHWDISGPSSPFRDTTHNPSLFWYQPLQENERKVNQLSFHTAGGLEHASNGRDGTASRSMDTVFAKATGIYQLTPTTEMRIGLKMFHFLKKSGNNADMRTYRQNLDLEYGFFSPNTFGLGLTYRHGKNGKGSAQFDATYALCELSFLKGWPGYLHIQTFSGYGETIADYNVRKPTQVRIGYMIERVSGRTSGNGCAR